MNLLELIDSGFSIMGYDLEQLVMSELENGTEEAKEVSTELYNTYFADSIKGDNNFKPVKFVYYKIVKNKLGVYTLRRDLNLSPRAKGYFSTEGETEDAMRDVARNKQPILGSELKAIVEDAIQWEFYETTDDSEKEYQAYRNFSQQIAKYIYDYFINCEKPIKDNIWYVVSCKEYGTATVYRDLTKSPRVQKQA